MKIEEIRLRQALPKVFVGEPERHSDVWQTDLVLRRGEFYIISAESGTGKSSMCAYIYGSRKDYVGDITFNGKDVRDLKIKDWQQIRRENLAYLPQELALFPELTAWENIMLKNNLTNHASHDQIKEWMRLLGIEDRTDFPVGKMSVGQQQRVGIIRSICQPFDFLLLDEPVSHLDEGNNRIAANLVMEEARRQGAAILATSVGNHMLFETEKFLNL